MNDIYIYHNGNFVKESELSVGVTNRGFRFGDLVFESVRLANSKICFLDGHLNRISQAMAALKIDTTGLPTIDETEKIFNELQKLNNIAGGGRGRITAYRKNGLTYKPDNNECSILIELRPYPDATYVLNEKGLHIGVYKENIKHKTTYSAYKTGNSLLYTLSAAYSIAHNYDEAIILNASGHVVETTSSNLFMVKGGRIYTPPLADGCVHGVMRNVVIHLATNNGIQVIEKHIVPADFETADELFLTNTISGARWVLACGRRRYFNNTAKQITQWLAELV